jgi:hypothetical protein
MLINYNQIKTLTFIAITLLPSQLLATGRATVEVNAKVLPKKRVELAFKTHPSEDLAINKDGPWKLILLSTGKLKFHKKEYKRSEWNEEIAGFNIVSSPTNIKSETIKYKLIAFICTKDKSQCYRDIIETTANVSW